MKKRDVAVGEVVPGTRLTILKPEDSDSHGNQMVRVRCGYCGQQKVMRLTAITHKPYTDCNLKSRKPNRSCGCQSKRACREYWEDRAGKIRRLVQQKIYRGNAWYGESLQELAERYNMPMQLVTTVFRLYAERHRPAGEGLAMRAAFKAQNAVQPPL